METVRNMLLKMGCRENTNLRERQGQEKIELGPLKSTREKECWRKSLIQKRVDDVRTR